MNAGPEHLGKLAEADREILEAWLIDFDQSWHDGRLAARVHDLPAAGHPLRLPALIELVKIDLERQWQQGRKIVLENYLRLYPELGTTTTVGVDLIQAEHRVRRHCGAPTELTEFAGRFPYRAEELRRQLEQEPDTPVRVVPVPFSQQPTGWGLYPFPEADKAGEELPQRLGRYHFLEQIGQGGMGTVVRVHDPDFDRTLAVKVMLPRLAAIPDADRRLLEEAKLTGQLQHPGIPPVHEMGRLDSGLPFFAMKLIQGRTLAQMLKDRGSKIEDRGSRIENQETQPTFLDPRSSILDPRFLGIFRQVCQTMAFAHARGVIHRDLKPANIMVGAFGEVQVMDWGLAKELTGEDRGSRIENQGSSVLDPRSSILDPRSETQTATGTVLGTPAYMAPEQARGEVHGLDERCDVFSLGAILYEILTGRPPFNRGVEPDLLRARDGDLVEALALLERVAESVGAELVELARRCLAPNKEDRPRHAGQVAQAVERYEAQVQQRLRQAELERAQAQVQAEEERKRREVEQARAEEERRRRQAEHAQLVAERRRRRATLLSAGTVLLLLAGAAGAALWYQQDQGAQVAQKARQQELSEQGMTAALKQARQTCQALQAKLAEPGGVFRLLEQPADWKHQIDLAREALRRARDLEAAAENPVGPDLRQKAQALEALLAQQQADWTLARRLEKIREDRSVWIDDKFDFVSAEREYPRAFGAAGLDLRNGSENETVTRIQRSAIKEQLLSALDDWAVVAAHRQDKDLHLHLLRVARRIDPDPWRVQVRDPAVWSNPQKLKALAEKALADPVRLSRLSPQMLSLVGTLLNREGAAERWLRQGQLLHPTDFWLNYVLGVALAKTRPHQAEGFYRAALAVRPKFSAAWNNLGLALSDQKDFQGAEAAYRQALRYDAKFVFAWYNLGIARRDQDDQKGAIAAYRQALQINPRFAKAWNHLGCALRALNDLKGALEAHHKALELDPTVEGGLNNLGRTLHAQKNLKDAIAAYRRALQRNPQEAWTWVNLGVALRDQGDQTGAIGAYRRAVAIDPNLVVAWLNLGNGLFVQKDRKGAVEAYRHALQLDPKRATAWYGLGHALHAQYRWKGAAQAYRQALSIDPKYVEAHINLGSVLTEQGDLEEAIRHLTIALELGTHRVNAHYRLACALHRQRDLNGAIHHYRLALKLGLKSTWAHHELGLALRDTKDWHGAVEQFTRSLELYPDNASAHSNLGLLLRERGRFAEALTHLQQGHQLGIRQPNWPDPSALRVQECERLLNLDQLLAAVLQGKTKVENPQELLQLADLCRRYKQDPAAAVRFYAAAFAAQPSLAEDLRNDYRYRAACCAALAAAGQGKSVPPKGKYTQRGEN